MECNILNKTQETLTVKEVLQPLDISLKLQRSMLQLKGSHMTEDGRGVDYEHLRGSKLFREYVELSSLLVNCDPAHLEDTHKTAFFISILINSVCTSVLFM